MKNFKKIFCSVIILICCIVYVRALVVGDSKPANTAIFTLDSYIKKYIINSPDLTHDYNVLKIAEINFKNNIINLFLPSAGVSAGTDLLSKSNPGLRFDNPYNFSLSVDWNIFNSGRDYLAYKKQKNSLEIAKMHFENRVQEIILLAIRTFYDLKRKESLLEVANNDLKDKQDQYEMTRLLYNDGLKSYTDFLQSENTLKNAQLSMEQETANYNSALIAFNNKIGREIMSPVKLDYDINEISELYKTSFEEDLQIAVANREDINRDILNFQNAKIDDKLKLMNNLPMLNTGFGLSNTTNDVFGGGTNRTDYSARLSLNFPVGFFWVDKYNDIQVSKMTLINQYMDFENLFRQIKENIFDIRNNLKFQFAGIEISRNNLKIAKERLHITRAEYNDGNENSYSLSLAQENYLTALIRDTNYKYDYQLARYSYQRALGLPIYDADKFVLNNKDFIERKVKQIERDFLSNKKR